MIETGYHKVKKIQDILPILENGFKPSTPAKRHWLGEGVYFFLDPEGKKWAKKWPYQASNALTNTDKGIIEAEIDTENAIDFRIEAIRKVFSGLLQKTKLSLAMSKKVANPTDGEAFDAIIRDGMYKKLLGENFIIEVIIANFDDTVSQYRIGNSKVILDDNFAPYPVNDTTAQVQACALSNSVIKNLRVEK